MTVETQDTIEAWRSQTFGPRGSIFRMAARANEELAELLRAMSAGKRKADIVLEAADVKIVLYGVAELNGSSLNPRSNFDKGGFRLEDSAASFIACECHAIMGLLLKETSRWNEPFPGAWQDPAVEHWCNRLAGELGALVRKLRGDIDQAVDHKMAVNRKRVWVKTDDGHGHHVRDKSQDRPAKGVLQ